VFESLRNKEKDIINAKTKSKKLRGRTKKKISTERRRNKLARNGGNKERKNIKKRKKSYKNLKKECVSKNGAEERKI
jgi:hypothetical protein